MREIDKFEKEIRSKLKNREFESSEIWRTVVTEDGIYENYMVSNRGNIKSLNYNRTGKEKILKPWENRGYLCVMLFKNGKAKKYKVHRLVAMAFIPNVMCYDCIDHKDINKKNNNTSNLVWCTQKQNINNELTKNKMSNSHKGKSNTARSKKVICLETGETFQSIIEVERRLNINNGNITTVCKGKRKRTGNLTFRYTDQVLFYN